MNFSPTPEQLEIKKLARDFANRVLKPNAAKWDEEAHFPQEALDELAKLGFLGMMIPEEWGGAGLDMISYVLALEEIAKGCASTAVIMSVHNSLFCGPIFRFGTEEQKKKYLPPFASGQHIGAYCLSEPHTGSDAANLITTATKTDSGYLLNGTKNWITSGPNAESMIVFAMTDKSKKSKGISAFIVEKNFPGFSVGKVEKKMGMRASSTSSIILENCEVPAENLLGKEGGGYALALASLDFGRIGIATQALGISKAAFERAVGYTKEREAFGQPISNFQAIQWMLADMQTRIDASELLIHRAAWLKANDLPCTREAAQAKLFSSETSNFVTNKALQIHGGYGYSAEYPLERHLRDARVTEIYEGTSEIQRLVIARQVLAEMP